MKKIAFTQSWKKAAVVLFAACGMQAIYAQTTVKDMAGRNVTVPAKVDRIACIGSGCLRQIAYLQATSSVVGAEDIEKNYPPERQSRPYRTANPDLAKLPRIGVGGSGVSNKKPEFEAILAVKPQVLFMTNMEAPLADEVQKTLGIPVVVLSYGKAAAGGSFDATLYESLQMAGKVLKREKRAADVVAYIQNAEKDVRQRTKGLPTKSSYVGAVCYAGTHGINGSSKQYLPFEWAGVNNLVKDLPGGTGSHIKIDKEALLKMNPEVIFVDACSSALVEEDARKNPEFYKALRAFSSKNAYWLFPFVSYTVNADTAIVDAYAVGKIMYPQAFADIDLRRKADEIYTFMVGKPVYEEMRKGFGELGAKVNFGQ